LNDACDENRLTVFTPCREADYASQFGVTCSQHFSPLKTWAMVEEIGIEYGCGDAVGLRPERVPR
jgi:hypothetical protein